MHWRGVNFGEDQRRSTIGGMALIHFSRSPARSATATVGSYTSVIGWAFGLLLGWRVSQTRGARGFGVLPRLGGSARGYIHLGRAPFTIHSVNHSRTAVRAQQTVGARAEARPSNAERHAHVQCLRARGAGGEPDGTD